MVSNREKQREATRERVRRYRAKAKSVTSVTPSVTPEGVTEGTIDIGTLAAVDVACGDKLTHNLPANFGQPDCECRHCRVNASNKTNLIINHEPYKTAGQLGTKEVNRVALLGDVDYCKEI